MRAAARAIALAALCLAAACSRSQSNQEVHPATAAPPAPIDGRIDPAPYRVQIEATEAVLYAPPHGDEQWKSLSKALLDLHNAIVFRDSSALARETSQRLFFFSAQVDAAPAGKHVDEQLQVMRGVWEKIRADQFARADWFHTN
jgi:hypothetical protein